MSGDDNTFDLTRRKALAGLGTIGAASTGAGLGTSAYFNDTESFTGNSVEAGELDLFVHYETSVSQDGVNTGSKTESGTIDGNPAEGEYVINDVKPGDSGRLKFCFSILDNPAYLWANGSLTGDADNSADEPEDDTPWERDGDASGELATYTRATLSYLDGSDNKTEITSGTLKGILADLEAGIPLHGNGNPEAGVIDRPTFDGSSDPNVTDDICLVLDWNVPDWIGNEVQSDSVNFDLSFYAEQARHNDGSGSATVVQPGDDLQTAIDDASSGDTLLLAEGRHTGQVIVDKTLDIRGEGPSHTTYDAFDVHGSGSLTSNRDLGMQIRADDVRVGDLTATGADQVIQFNDNGGSSGRLSGGMVSNALVEDNGNEGRGRALVINYTDGAMVRDTVIQNNGNDGLTGWYANDTHVENVDASENGDNGLYFNGDSTIILDSTVEDNAEEGVDISWKDELKRDEQRVTLDNVVAKNNGQSDDLESDEGEDIELHDDGSDDVADSSALLRKVTTEGSSAPLGLRLVQVDESEVETVQCSFPNGREDGENNDVDP